MGLVGIGGWWELGRSVSLSPVETAKASKSPLVDGVGESEASGILCRIEGKKVICDGDYMNNAKLKTSQ